MTELELARRHKAVLMGIVDPSRKPALLPMQIHLARLREIRAERERREQAHAQRERAQQIRLQEAQSKRAAADAALSRMSPAERVALADRIAEYLADNGFRSLARHYSDALEIKLSTGQMLFVSAALGPLVEEIYRMRQSEDYPDPDDIAELAAGRGNPPVWWPMYGAAYLAGEISPPDWWPIHGAARLASMVQELSEASQTTPAP